MAFPGWSLGTRNELGNEKRENKLGNKKYGNTGNQKEQRFWAKT
jgi:hypothetical protein